ncbi:MAG: hypothetical protein KY455_01645 [Euryarchaeota archaeon]|nr:hypothetical protein [Euryarchaeota archaeon]
MHPTAPLATLLVLILLLAGCTAPDESDERLTRDDPPGWMREPYAPECGITPTEFTWIETIMVQREDAREPSRSEFEEMEKEGLFRLIDAMGQTASGSVLAWWDEGRWVELHDKLDWPDCAFDEGLVSIANAFLAHETTSMAWLMRMHLLEPDHKVAWRDHLEGIEDGLADATLDDPEAVAAKLGDDIFSIYRDGHNATGHGFVHILLPGNAVGHPPQHGQYVYAFALVAGKDPDDYERQTFRADGSGETFIVDDYDPHADGGHIYRGQRMLQGPDGALYDLHVAHNSKTYARPQDGGGDIPVTAAGMEHTDALKESVLWEAWTHGAFYGHQADRPAAPMSYWTSGGEIGPRWVWLTADRG